jgi:hypothetical protein
VARQSDEAPTRLEQMTAYALAEGILSDARARQICPPAVAQSLPEEPEPDRASQSQRALLPRSRMERHEALAAAAKAAADLYREDADLTGFEAFAAEDLLDDAAEG